MRGDGIRAGCLLLASVLLMAACTDPADTGSDAGAGADAGLTGGWSTAGCELPREPRTTTVGGVDMPVTPPALEAAIARIERGGRADFADSYAGLEVDQDDVRAIVYRVPSAAFDDFVRQSAADTCVVVRDAAHAARELDALHDRIVNDLPYWNARGVAIASVGSRHDGAGVEVGARDVERARRELTARYGAQAALVFAQQGPVVPMTSSGPTTAAPQPGD